jgi:hypothetical protein
LRAKNIIVGILKEIKNEAPERFESNVNELFSNMQ